MNNVKNLTSRQKQFFEKVKLVESNTSLNTLWDRSNQLLRESKNTKFYQLMVEAVKLKSKELTGFITETAWALPKSDKEVDEILSFLKSNIKADTAGGRMYNMLGDTGLYDLIAVLKVYNPEMCVNEPIVNHIVNIDVSTLPPENQPYVESLKESIFYDADLLEYVNKDMINESAPMPLAGLTNNLKTPPSSQNKPISNLKTPAATPQQSQTPAKPNPQLSFASRALQTDLVNLQKQGKDTTEEKYKKFAMRAKQYKTDPAELKADYVKQFKDKGLLEGMQEFFAFLKLVHTDKLDTQVAFDQVCETFAVTPKAMKMIIEDYKKVLKKKKSNIPVISEDVIPFPGNRNKPIKQTEPAKVLNLPKANHVTTLATLITKAKKLIDQTDMSDSHRNFTVVHSIPKMCGDEGIEFSEFLQGFYRVYDEDYYKYIHNKAFNDYVEQVQMNDGLNESISCETAKKCRNDLWKFFNKTVDTSNIMMLSNFESYEDKDEIELKMAVYADTPAKLEDTLSSLVADLQASGFEKTGETVVDNITEFAKGESLVRISPIAKRFRSGPYKNREVPSLILSVYGPKKIVIDDDGEEIIEALDADVVTDKVDVVVEEANKPRGKDYRHCDKCEGKGTVTFADKTGKCFKCNGKGWTTPQNVINNAAAMRKLQDKVWPAPRQYKDD